MPMNPRLLLPRSAGKSLSDADATAYLTAVESADQQALEPAVRLAIHAFVVGCKQDGIWSAIKASCILMGARTLSGALTPLVGTAPTNNGPFVSGDYNRETGLIGNGSTKYLDSGRSGSSDPQNDHHLSVYVSEALSTGTHLIGLSSTDIISIAASSAIRSRNAAAASLTAISGFHGFSRSSSTAWQYRISGTTTTGPTTTSAAAAAGNFFVFARNHPTPGHVNARMVFYSIGQQVNLALLDSRVTTLYAAIGAAI